MQTTSGPTHQNLLRLGQAGGDRHSTEGCRFSGTVCSVALGVLAFAWQAHAAGGHHFVDDAALLEPGQCEVESWSERENGGNRKLFHVGSSCRMGPIELGLNAERNREAGSPAVREAGVQVKWAYAVTDSLSTGVVGSVDRQDTSSGSTAATVVLPFTWKASESLQAHANWGRDFQSGGHSTVRYGAALEWAPLPAWSLVAERFRESQTNFARVGARYAVNPDLSVDLSHTRGLGNSALPWLTFGVSWIFDR